MGRGFDARGDTAFATPGFRAVAGLGVAAHGRGLCDSPLYPHLIGDRFDQPVKHGVAREAEDVVQPIGLAPRHHLRTTVMAVAANGQARVGPMLADAPYQAAKMVPDLLPGWRLAWPQQHRHRPRCRRVIDMDRQKAAFAIMAVEQREPLMPVHDVGRVVDVEGDGGRRPGVAGTIEIDHGIGHTHHLAPARRVLPARHRRLRAQIAAAVGQAVAGQLERGIGAQMVEIVRVFVAAGDSENAGAQNVIDAVGHEGGVARVRKQPRQLHRDPQLPLHRAEQQDAAIGGDAPTVEGSDQLLALDGWKAKRQDRIIGHGGCGSMRWRGQDGFDTQS